MKKRYILFFLFVISLFITYKFCNRENLKYEEITIANDLTVNSKMPIMSEKIGELYFENLFQADVMQHSDNDYYLSHDEAGNYRKIGSVFLDYRINQNISHKLIMYGHNSSKVATPFKNLEKFLKTDFFNDNSTLIYNDVIYTIAMICLIKGDYYYTTDRDDNLKEQLDYLKKYAVNKRVYDTIDNLLVLQTCSETEKGSFIVLFAVN